MRKLLILALTMLYTLNLFSITKTYIREDGLVEFVYINKSAKDVYVAGSFNSWNSTKDKMEKVDDSKFIKTIKLNKGKYIYKFVVDGNWIPDDNAQKLEDDGYGNKNSIIEISHSFIPEIEFSNLKINEMINKKKDIKIKIYDSILKNGISKDKISITHNSSKIHNFEFNNLSNEIYEITIKGHDYLKAGYHKIFVEAIDNKSIKSKLANINFIVDYSAPKIVHNPIKTFIKNHKLIVKTKIYENNLKKATLFYSNTGKKFEKLNMFLEKDNIFSQTISAKYTNSKKLFYYIKSFDGIHETRFPINGYIEVKEKVAETSFNLLDLQFLKAAYSKNSNISFSFYSDEKIKFNLSLNNGKKNISIFKDKKANPGYNKFSFKSKQLRLGTYKAIFVFNSMNDKSFKIEKRVDLQIASRSKRVVPVVFLLHFNQNMNIYADIANDICYNSLLKTMRKHKKLKFNIQISGTLIQAMKWFSKESYDLLKAGIEDGQFEIFTSTYSQAIMLSVNEFTNQNQLNMQNMVLKNHFNYKAQGFWNPERCFDYYFLDFLYENGIKYTMVEDHILTGSGIEHEELNYFSRAFTAKNSMIIFNDSKDLSGKIGGAIYNGDINLVKNYFDSELKSKDIDKKVYFYGEDAEIVGLHQWWISRNPEKVHKNFDNLLTYFDKSHFLKLVKASELEKYKKPVKSINYIKQGEATWMNEDLKNSSARYFESGYSSWFDFNRNSKKLIHFREKFKFIESQILHYEAHANRLKDNNKKYAISNLLKRAKLNYALHQHEFGCIGIGSMDNEVWKKVNTIFVNFVAIDAIINSKEEVIVKDIDFDNINETLLINKTNLVVVSSIGGRILYWIDLKKGIEYIGNEYFLDTKNFVSDQFYKENIKYSKPKKYGESANFENEREYSVRKRSLNDSVKINKKSYKLFNNIYAANITSNNSVTLFTKIKDNDTLIKDISLNEDSLKITYSFKSKKNRSVVLTSHNEFSPNLMSIMNSYNNIIENRKTSGSGFSIINSLTKERVLITIDNAKEVRIGNGIFSKFVDIDMKMNYNDSLNINFIKK